MLISPVDFAPKINLMNKSVNKGSESVASGLFRSLVRREDRIRCHQGIIDGFAGAGRKHMQIGLLIGISCRPVGDFSSNLLASRVGRHFHR
jgi:hypothetical protein